MHLDSGHRGRVPMSARVEIDSVVKIYLLHIKFSYGTHFYEIYEILHPTKISRYTVYASVGLGGDQITNSHCNNCLIPVEKET